MGKIFQSFDEFINESYEQVEERKISAPKDGFKKEDIEKILKKSKDVELVANKKQYYIVPFMHSRGKLTKDYADSDKMYVLTRDGDEVQINFSDIEFIEEGVSLDAVNDLDIQDEVIAEACKVNDEIQEGRKTIKRGYGVYSATKVNKKAPLRNEIIKHIGDANKPLSENDINDLLLRVEEDRGKAINKKRWFESNKHYFKWSKVENSKCCQLSKIGQRVYDSIVRDGISTKKINSKLNED